jgi:hypothetical protein
MKLSEFYSEDGQTAVYVCAADIGGFSLEIYKIKEYTCSFLITGKKLHEVENIVEDYLRNPETLKDHV